MSRIVYDTRFFIEHYYSSDNDVLRRTREEMRRTRERYISAVVIHEVYRLTLEREGRETAVLRATLLEKDFKVVDVGPEVAKISAEMRHRYKISMADSMIASTSMILKATCLSDDPHYKKIAEIKTKWI